MSKPRLPATGALRAFEAAARTLSFTRAAKELNVTQAAVSYQVRQLERDMGKMLFRRQHRRLMLTDAAASYLPFVREALELLAEGAVRLTRDGAGNVLSVSATQSLTTRWLVHRIHGFAVAHPEIRVRIHSTDDVVDLVRTDTDIALRYAKSVDPRLVSTPLSVDRVFPVMSPGLAYAGGAVRTPPDLRRHTLLHDAMTDVTWNDWLATAGAQEVNGEGGVYFSSSAAAIDAAIAGQGIALGRPLLVVDDLLSGRLVQPFELSLSSEYTYFVVHGRNTEDNANARAFKEWLGAEVRAADAVSLTDVSKQPGASPR